MNLDDLIERHMKGELSPEEEAQLQQLSTSDKHKQAFEEALFKVARLYLDEAAPTKQDPVERAQLEYRLEQNLVTRITADATPRPVIHIWRWISGVAAASLVGIAAYFYIASQQSDSSTPHAFISFIGPRQVVLPDNSHVTLNAGSTLEYDSAEWRTFRHVKLQGEAFFDVTHDPDHKFVVQAGKVTTTVLGTAFNIKEAAGNTIVTVSRGKVQVEDQLHHKGIITPNQQIAVAEAGTFTQADVKAEEMLNWKKQYLYFQNARMQDVAEDLEQRFGVTITFVTKDFMECKMNGEFIRGESLDDILAIISATFHGKYAIEGRRVSLSGSCN